MAQSVSTYSETDLSLCQELATLNGEHRKFMREMVALLARIESEPV
jgi:hypothetical protein